MGQGQKSGKIEALKAMSFPVTTAVWAPNGQYVVLAGFKTRYDRSLNVHFHHQRIHFPVQPLVDH